jgi:peptidoglycan/xylan/chitin deacetylase (PgdA/CDA1 family)
MPTGTAILTYHSQNVRGYSTADNDHVALQADLEHLHSAGLRIVSLGRLIDLLDGHCSAADLEGTVCLSFDDGCDFDVRDLDFPGVGVQRSFLGILEDFKARHGDTAQPGLHATSFVIASEKARRVIDSRSLFGHGWISDDWWQESVQSGLLTIANHGWDHNHPDLDPHAGGAGGFTSIDTQQQCERQVIQAATTIAEKSGRWPDLFAYPFGESSAFIRERFFPGQIEHHRCRAALGTYPGLVTEQSNRWNLPRFVCGRDWRTPDELLGVIGADKSGNP